MSAQEKKAESSANRIQPRTGPESDKANETEQTLPHGVEAVKRDPWLTLWMLRDDLKIVTALLDAGDRGSAALALVRARVALDRIGDGSWTAEVGS